MPGNLGRSSFGKGPRGVSGSSAAKWLLDQFYFLSNYYLVLEVGAGSHLDVHHTRLVEVRQETFKFEVVCRIAI